MLSHDTEAAPALKGYARRWGRAVREHLRIRVVRPLLVPSPRNWTLLGALVCALGLAVLVLSTDPVLWSERIFIFLLACCSSALCCTFTLHLSSSRRPPWRTLGRAIRRGCLAGLGCTAAVVLHLLSGLTITNLAFAWLLLLIVELFFLSGYRDAPSNHATRQEQHDLAGKGPLD